MQNLANLEKILTCLNADKTAAILSINTCLGITITKDDSIYTMLAKVVEELNTTLQ